MRRVPDLVWAWLHACSVDPVAPIDDELVTGVIRAGGAGEVDGGADEVGRLPPPAFGDALQDVLTQRLLGEGALGRRRLDPAGEDRVRANAVARELDRARPCQRDDSRLGR